jgi:hypothetical protein
VVAAFEVRDGAADFEDAVVGARREPDNSLNFTAGTSTWMSMRSSSGPEMRPT